jgi:CubicO group peptidase (beta-lactamase class C family)
VLDKPLGFEPGKQMNYSNTGYILLGMVIEKASGMGYADFIKQNILDPLEMNDSGNEVNATVLPQRAEGYSTGPSGIINAAYIDMTVPYSAGAMYSTVEDLLRWQRGLFGGKLLSQSSLVKMTTPALNDYAFGVAVTKKADITEIRHGGGINGFNSHLAYFPDSKHTVVVLSNINGGGADGIGNKVAALLRGETVVLPTERKTVKVPKQTLEKYLGTYELRPGFNLWFFIRGEQLVSQATNQGEVPLAAESPTRFFPLAFEAQIEFQQDAGGKVTGLIHRQNGRETKAPRISDTAPAK